MDDHKELVIEIRNLIKVLKEPIERDAKALEHYNVEEIGAILHCSNSSVRNIIRDNQFKTLVYKGIVRVSRLQIEKFILKHTS